MKIRTSYVSNSSSSSFLLLGYFLKDENSSRFFELAKKLDPRVAEEYADVEEFFSDEGYIEIGDDKLSVLAGDGENGVRKGQTFVGKYESYSEEDEITLDVAKTLEDLKLIEESVAPEERSLKVVSGSRYC